MLKIIIKLHKKKNEKYAVKNLNFPLSGIQLLCSTAGLYIFYID